jgi:site-specific recombinase XerD
MKRQAISLVEPISRVQGEEFHLRPVWQISGLSDGHDIRTIQELLGHANVTTTMVYTHALNRGARGVRSPFDPL